MVFPAFPTHISAVPAAGGVGNFNPKFQPVRNKTNRENTRQKKQSHAQDNIYVVRQFAYVHGVAGISLLLGKIQ